MPPAHFANQRGLQTSSEFLLDRGRSFLSGNTWFVLSESLFSLDRGIHLLPRSSIGSAREFYSCSPFAVLAGEGSAPSAVGLSVQPCVSSLLWERGQRVGLCQSMMSTSIYVQKGSELGAKQTTNVDDRFGLTLSSKRRVYVCYGYKGLDNCRRISSRLNNRQLSGSNMVYKSFWSNVSGRGWRSSSSVNSAIQDFQPSCSSPYSTGADPDVSFDRAVQGEQHENADVYSEQNVLGNQSLKLLSGSCYMPHPDKEETGGDDAHFICVNEQAIGVADGVGGWADLGIDAGQYARELMSNSVSAIQEEPKGLVDPARVLEKAYLITKAKGSSTACIIALTEQGVHAVNLGDSGFIVVRDGSTIFKSPVQQHDFNLTYQLESGNGSDLPSSAQVFTFPVAHGDVIVAATDGLFDNLYNNEVTAVVVHAVRAGLGPQVTAQKIAALARQRAVDRNRQTPFSTAAQDAGYRYYGGKLDDITVVVSYITTSDA